MGAQRERAMAANRRRKARQQSLVAPVGGLNTLAAFGAMPPEDAWELVNWIPDVGVCRVRPGYETRSVDMDEVLTLASFESGSTFKFLAATSDTIWDITNDQSFFAEAARFEEQKVAFDSQLLSPGEEGALSIWVRNESVGSDVRIFGHDRFELLWTSDSKYNLVGKNSSGTTILNLTTQELDADTWYNLLISWNNGTQTAHVYINNVATTAANPSPTVDTINYDWQLLELGSEATTMTLSELWFDDNYINFSVSGNRSDFIDSSDRPVNVGSDGSTPTGNAPFIYLTGEKTSFLVNQGTAEDFTGTPPIAAFSSPSMKPVELKTGLTRGRWQHWQFNERLFLANGADTMQVYDGSSIGDTTFSGPTLDNLIGGNSFKNRVYVWEEESTSFWYGGVNSISGAMTEFDLSRVGRLGGHLVQMVTWTVDGGDGVDDMAVFLMSSGEVIVYQGSNPGDSNAWQLVGVYRIGVPLSRRSAIKFAGDIAIQTQEDYVLLSQVLRENIRRTKISGAARDAAELYATNQGWQLQYYPKSGWIISNIPVSGTRFDQHILNVVTNAWTTFKDMNARCWEVHDRDLYFGGADGVFKADTGTSDNGSLIDTDARQAWNSMGVQGLKRFTAYRPVFEAAGTLTYTASLAFDYQSAQVSTEASTASSGTPWGSPWGSAWSPNLQIKQDWRTGTGIGNQMSLRIRTSTENQTVKWYRTDFLFETGGVM